MAGTPGPHRRVLLRRAFDEHFLDRADAGLVTAERAALDDLREPLHPFLHHLRRHELVDHGRGFGAGPRREHERVGRVVVGVRDDRERCREVGLRFAGEPDDQVGGDREIGDRGACGLEPRQVPRRGVAAVHAGQCAVAPRLQRQVQVLADGRALCHRRDRLGAEILRVRRREPHALDAVDRVDRPQEVREFGPVLPGAEVTAVRVDVLAEQRDLGDAVGRQRLDLVHDVAHAPADLSPAHGRDDAERARVVTTDLDRDPRGMVDLASRRERRRIRLVLLQDLDDRAGGARALEQCRRAREVVRPEHDVDVRCAREHLVAVLLGETAAHCDLQVGPSVLQRLQVPEVAVELVVRVLADAARVEDDHVGGREIVGRFHAFGREQARDAFRVVLVHLAAEGAHEEPAGHRASVRAEPRSPRGHHREVDEHGLVIRARAAQLPDVEHHQGVVDEHVVQLQRGQQMRRRSAR